MAAGEGYKAYTDGGCSPNPGPGGWGVVLVSPDGATRELSGGEARTTNNRMELTAAIEALRAVPGEQPVTVVTDSLYVKNGISSWLAGWRRKGWRTAGGGEVKNRDLWQVLDTEVRRREVRWEWTRGHAGNRLNERADELATSRIVATAEGRPEPLADRTAAHAFVGVAFSSRRKGAWAVVLCHGDREWSVLGALSETTTNRLLVHAALDAVAAVGRDTTLHVYTSASYLANGAGQWLARWKRSGWRTREGQPVANASLWRRLDQLQAGRDVSYHLVASRDQPSELERAGELARQRLGR